jgi:uncharacterized protein YceH (UPF0502 family)
MNEASHASSSSTSNEPAGAAWGPLNGYQRRVAAAIVEKAKTTPNAYPMSLNAIRVACNQTSNRDPVMELDEDQVQETLDELREKHIVLEVHGAGRVPKYRHMMYEWLGVNKLEMAIMVELLLRGAQTEGELRSRAARMETFPDLNALRAVLDGLKARKLVIPLTPEGRGHMLTHGLYEPREMERIRAKYSSMGSDVPSYGSSPATAEMPAARPTSSTPPPVATQAAPSGSPSTPRGSASTGEAAVLERVLRAATEELQASQRELQAQIQELRSQLEEVRDQYEQRIASLERFRDDVGG